MPTLTCEIAELMMHSLLTRSTLTGEPVLQIVTRALADALEMEHATLF